MTASPFELWSRMLSASWGMAATGQRFGETMIAADSVVRHRSATIDAAMRNPLTADHAELGMMVSEKAEAFASAGTSLMSDMLRLQMDMMAQGAAWGAMMATGRPPSPKAAGAMAERSQRMMTRAMASGGRALAPIHKKATANAKRLSKKG